MDGDDLVALHAAGRLYLGGVAFFLADQRTRDRAGDVDEAVLQVGFVFADDLVFDLLAACFLFEFDGGGTNGA